MMVNNFYGSTQSNVWDFESEEGLKFDRLPKDLMKCLIFLPILVFTSKQHLYSEFAHHYYISPPLLRTKAS